MLGRFNIYANPYYAENVHLTNVLQYFKSLKKETHFSDARFILCTVKKNNSTL